MIDTVATESSRTPRLPSRAQTRRDDQGPKLSDIIKASGLKPHQQAGHMTEADQPDQPSKTLAKRPSTYDGSAARHLAGDRAQAVAAQTPSTAKQAFRFGGRLGGRT